jgi:hypothetical protein
VASIDTGAIQKFELTLAYPAQPCGPSAVRHSFSIVADSCSGTGTGGGNGFWDEGEDAQIAVTLRNNGTVALTNVSARLVPLGGGTTVPDDTALFADMAPGATSASEVPHFTARLPEGFGCGAAADFRVDILSDQGSFSDTLSLTSGQVVPGGGTALDESFAAGIPAGWTVIDGGSGGAAAATWTTANPGNRTFVWPLVAPVAIVDSDNAGSSSTQDEEMITSPLDLSTATAVTLELDQYFRVYTGGQPEKGDVDVRSSLTGGSWVNVLRSTGTSSTNPDHRTVDITAQAAGAPDVQIRFHYYDAQWEFWWEVDNVKVTFSAPNSCISAPCAAAVEPPGEVAAASLLWSGTKDALSWDPVATASSYRVYRGAGIDLPLLLDATPDSCLRATTASTTAGDLAEAPPEGSLLWWLVRAANAGGEGPAGQATSGPRNQDSLGACP